jgi:hypothetical protein
MSHLFLSRNIDDGNAWTGIDRLELELLVSHLAFFAKHCSRLQSLRSRFGHSGMAHAEFVAAVRLLLAGTA